MNESTVAIDDEIRAVAVLISIGLALLTLFTERHADTLGRVTDDLDAYTGKELRRQLVRDILLAGLTLVSIAAITPLFFPAVDSGELFQRDGVMRTLFLVIYIAYVPLFVFQCLIAWRRFGRLQKKTDT